MYMWLLEPDQISDTQSMVDKREAAQIGQTFIIPLCKKFV